jgi:flagella basal body P-ring formation protein FlgA
MFLKEISGSKLNTLRLSRSIYLTLTFLSLIIVADDLKADQYQSLESIQFQAEEYIMQFDYKTPYLPEFRSNHLDSRLKLANCNKPLHVTFSNLQKMYGRTSLNISCQHSPKWNIHLPIRVKVFDDVLVAQQPINRSQKIDGGMLEYAKKDIALLNQGYFIQKDHLKNKESRLNLKRGSVLTPNNTRPSDIVKSGQNVTLILDYNGINIRASGKALQSARMGQLIKVRNSQSQKIVEGIVSGEGLVKVSL